MSTKIGPILIVVMATNNKKHRHTNRGSVSNSDKRLRACKKEGHWKDPALEVRANTNCCKRSQLELMLVSVGFPFWGWFQAFPFRSMLRHRHFGASKKNKSASPGFVFRFLRRSMPIARA